MSESSEERRRIGREEFERLFGVELEAEDYVGIYISRGVAEATADEAALNYDITVDHCGSSTSSTLSLEFFVAISQEAWERATG